MITVMLMSSGKNSPRWRESRCGAAADAPAKAGPGLRDIDTLVITISSSTDNRPSERMENTDEDEELKLIKASAGLLTDLEHGLHRLLFKPGMRKAHTRVKQRDLDHVVNLVR